VPVPPTGPAASTDVPAARRLAPYVEFALAGSRDDGSDLPAGSTR